MRTLLLAITGIFLCTGAMAQNAGDIYVGGTFNFNNNVNKSKTSNSSTTGNKTLTYTILPDAAYFMSNNLAVGAALGYRGTRTVNPNPTGDDQITNNSSVVINPYGRYYMSLGNNVYFVGQGGLSIALGGQTSKQGNQTNKGRLTRDYGVAISPGIAFQASDKIALELFTTGIRYQSSVTIPNRDNKDNKNITNTFSFGPSLGSLTVGIRYFL